MAETQVFLSLQIPASLPAGVYSLDLGPDVVFRVLYTDLAKIEQVAPAGIVLSPGSALFFSVPSSTSAVDLFAYRGFRIFDSAGHEIAKTPLDAPAFGRFQFNAQSGGPTFSVAPGHDQYFSPGVTKGETFVNLVNIPATVASGEPGRLFAFNHRIIPFPWQLGPPLPQPVVGGHRFDPGFAGDGIVLDRSVVELPAPAGFPFNEGTIEFWMRPLWSTTDFPIDRLSGTTPVVMVKRLDLFSMPPLQLRYSIDPDSSGRTTRYAISQLKFRISGLVNGNNQDGAVVDYPTRLYFQQGRWYHVAATWKIDGAQSAIALFVNGRQRSLEVFDEELGPILPAMNYAAVPIPGGPIHFGAGKPCPASQCDPPGEQFDELRISRGRRYVGDFPPPTGPFASDAQTYLLMHFDHTLDIVGRAGQGSVVASTPP